MVYNSLSCGLSVDGRWSIAVIISILRIPYKWSSSSNHCFFLACGSQNISDVLVDEYFICFYMHCLLKSILSFFSYYFILFEKIRVSSSFFVFWFFFYMHLKLFSVLLSIMSVLFQFRLPTHRKCSQSHCKHHTKTVNEQLFYDTCHALVSDMLSKLIVCLSRGSKYLIILHANHHTEIIMNWIYAYACTVYHVPMSIDKHEQCNEYTMNGNNFKLLLKWMFIRLAYDGSWLETALEPYADKRITYTSILNHLQSCKSFNEINWIMSATDCWMLNTDHISLISKMTQILMIKNVG